MLPVHVLNARGLPENGLRISEWKKNGIVPVGETSASKLHRGCSAVVERFETKWIAGRWY